MAGSTEILAGQRKDLTATLKALRELSTTTSAFVKENRGRLVDDLDEATAVLDTMVGRKDQLAETFDLLPLVAENITRAYDPETRRTRIRVDVRNTGPFSAVGRAELCRLLRVIPDCDSLTRSRRHGRARPAVPLVHHVLPGGPVMSTSMIGWFARLGAAVASAAALSACGADLSDVPLPSQVSGPTYEIEAVFDSALNLPRQAPVKLDGRTVGDVVSVEAVDYTARVRLRISDETRLPAGTRAQTRLSAPVGEAFVALLPPEDAAGGAHPEHGDVLDREVTDTAPDTTDLLTGLSAAVTGGSYADLKVVIEELVTAFDGRGGDVRHLVRRLDSVVTSVNTHRDDIDAALDGLDRLSAQLADDTDSIAASAEALAPAIRVWPSRRTRRSTC